eukprot:234485_1
MDSSPFDIIPIVYISFQVVVLIAVSISGVLFIQNAFKQQNIIPLKEYEQQLKIQQETHENNPKIVNVDVDTIESTEHQNNEHSFETINKITFCKLWIKITWKMRSVYGSFVVHTFDVLTDILVIIEWWNLEKYEGDINHINSNIMAICALTVLLFHRIISTIAFWAKEANIIRCIFQFVDILIFEEIYVSHKQIISQFKNEFMGATKQSSKNIDTTTSFKFVRNLEAIFESIPQSILQLVFIMRSSDTFKTGNNTILLISILSIIQSIISMTNSILKNDNILMTLPKWKQYKKRLPPTIQFIKHFICRLAEIVYRIGLLSLFWTVCKGEAFAVLIFFEVLIIIILYLKYVKKKKFTIDELCLLLQTIIVLPSELVYAEKASYHPTFAAKFNRNDFKACTRRFWCTMSCGICFCYTPSVLISTLCHFGRQHYIHCNLRIAISMMEWVFIILCAIFMDNRFFFLFSVNHGLYVFIVSIICYIIYTQYLYLFPDFSLPFNVSGRSRFGYAFNGELDELQRIKIPEFPYKYYPETDNVFEKTK